MEEGRNDYGFGAEDEPIGVVYSDKRRRWSHKWTELLVWMLTLFGLIAGIGAARPFSWLRMCGALLIVGGAAAVSRSDRLHKTSRRAEVTWAAAGAVLVVGGGVLFGVST